MSNSKKENKNKISDGMVKYAQMTESCGENSVFSDYASVSQIGTRFPGAIEVYTQGAFHFARKKGVYVLNTGNSRQIRIIGQCPNFQNGSCILKGGCFSPQPIIATDK